MKMKQMIAMACAAALCVDAWAEDEKKPAELREEETPVVSAEFGLAFDSKFMSYGLVDNKDPIFTPSASVTFFDWISFGVGAFFDVTKYGKKHGEYGNRAGKYTELDPEVAIAHSFSPDDCDWLPTTIELSLGYAYEYHPRHMGGGTGEAGDDTQFVNFEIALPDLWVEPTLVIERDIDRDNGMYVNLELGHTFPLVDGAGEDDDPVLGLRPSIGQGIGNTRRTRGYGLAEDHGGMMDTCVRIELTWNICDHLALSAYGAYYDYVFDRTLRHAAREYEASGQDDTSYHFVGGLALTTSF